MIVAGITGAMGSGKTTFCKEWEKLGAVLYYADDEAKKLMVSDEILKRELVEAFGEETYQSDGSLNKNHLIREAFEKNRVELLNSIVHPAVARHFRLFCEDARNQGENLVIKEAALLLNKGRPKELNVVVMVLSDRDVRIKRVVERDGISDEKILERDRKQPDFQQLQHLADYIIHNNGTLEELKGKARDLYSQILENHQ